jgi:polyhydroxybutyrate depolymerase
MDSIRRAASTDHLTTRKQYRGFAATLSRRAFLAGTLGAGLSGLTGCRRAQAGATNAPVRATPVLQATAVQPATATQAPGRSFQQLTVGDVTRQYLRYEPSALAAAPAPLLVALHGRGGNGRFAEAMFGFNELADRVGFVVAYPDALGEPPTWNEGFVGLSGGPFRPDDVGFVRAIVQREANARPLDPRRIFVCGHSSGGMMTYRLASEVSDLFAAAGVVAGSVGYRGPNGGVQAIPQPARPVPIIHVHGTADTLVPYDGGDGSHAGGLQGFLSVAESVGFWVKANGCDPTPTTEIRGSARRDTYAGPAEVTLWTIEGGGHGWPRVSAGVARRNEPAAGISATELIWEFFSRQART